MTFAFKDTVVLEKLIVRGQALAGGNIKKSKKITEDIKEIITNEERRKELC